MSTHNYSDLEIGLYENLVDSVLQEKIESAGLSSYAEYEKLDKAEIPRVFSAYVASRLEHLLASGSKSERIGIMASVLEALDSPRQCSDHTALPLRQVGSSNDLVLEFLAEVKEQPKADPLNRPLSRLRHANLITNAPHDPSLEQELTSEFASADAIDAVIAFIRGSSMHTLYKQFGILRDRGIPVRIITSTYTGATERRVLDRLVRDFGVQVKVSYNSERTRLHAKSWLIHRNTGFNTAYIGSSNLSKAAMQSGQEWNVRLSEAIVPEVFSKFRSVFDSYWQSPDYELYDPEKDAERFDEAIRKARSFGKAVTLGDKSFIESYSLLQVTPFPHQKIMLSELEAERSIGHHRNLLVAATGTGKTVVAAFDYLRFRDSFFKEHGYTPRTLFIAHRAEILKQAHRTFVEVTKISNLGISTTSDFHLSRLDKHLLAEHGNLVFASIQSFHEKTLDSFPADYFDFIIIDEFHHASAPTYKKLIDHFEPSELLGLTATPERGDNRNVAIEFFEGRIASQLRLWDALEADLLVPFHYFVTHDPVDLSDVSFTRGEYNVAELSAKYVGRMDRADVVMRAIQDKVPSPETMRALCFCVSVEHANFMADCFNRLNIAAKAVTASTVEREKYISQLAQGELRVICAVDIFNEGVDIPEVDTLIMLRPTQSPTVFLQQLGRGLRKSFGKELLTVLDFVGNQRHEFRFDHKLKALSGKPRRRLIDSVKKGFQGLPPGIYIEFDKVSQDIVLESLQKNLAVKLPILAEEYREYLEHLLTQQDQKPSLLSFLEFSGRELPDVYGRSSKNSATGHQAFLTLTRLEQLARTGQIFEADGEDIANRIRAFAHVTDVERLEAYRFLLAGDFASYADLSEDLKLYAHMLVFNIWPDGKRNGVFFDSIDSALDLLRSFPAITSEIIELMEYCVSNSRTLHGKPLGRLASGPLLLNAAYSKAELLAAFKVGYEFRRTARGTLPTPGSVREGVWINEAKTDEVLMVTLQKSESDFSYADYAISESLFHWQTQNKAKPTSSLGQRYINHERDELQITLFVRESSETEYGVAAPYVFCGPVRFISTEGSMPMSIVWELEHPLSPEVYQQAKAVAV